MKISDNSDSILHFFLFFFIKFTTDLDIFRIIWPMMIGNTTRMVILVNVDTKSTSPVMPKYPKIRTGLRNTPTRLLKAVLKTAAASSPPTDAVRMIVILTLIGMHAQIIIPSANSLDKIPSANASLAKPYTNPETTPKLKI